MFIVMKFGGTSVGSAERIAQAARLVTEQISKGHRVAVVTSAMSGVTNNLIDAAQAASKGNLDATLRQRLFERHKAVADAVIQDATVRSVALDLCGDGAAVAVLQRIRAGDPELPQNPGFDGAGAGQSALRTGIRCGPGHRIGVLRAHDHRRLAAFPPGVKFA